MTPQEAYTAMLDRLAENYVPLVSYHLCSENEIMLSDSVAGRCRFCGKSKPDVSFNKVAHAIPHFIGNRILKSTYECDDCNGMFSVMESNFAQYMGLYHTFAHVCRGGGAKVPKFRINSSEKSMIKVGDDNIDVLCYEGEGLVPEIYEKDNKLTITAHRSYVPLNVYKVFIKMALAIMPEVELPCLSTTLKWLHNDVEIAAKNLILTERYYMSEMNPFVFISCMLFKRKDLCTKAVPTYIFGLAYYNFFFQTYIPFCDTDKQLRGIEMTMPYIPTPLDDNGLTPLIHNHDLSSPEKICNEEVKIILKGESMIEVELENAEDSKK